VRSSIKLDHLRFFALMQNKWMELFPSIVSKARTIQVIHNGAASGHVGTGSLILVTAVLLQRLYLRCN
jgi:hypothetical protein